MKRVAKDAFHNKVHHHNTIETISKAYSGNKESFQ